MASIPSLSFVYCVFVSLIVSQQYPHAYATQTTLTPSSDRVPVIPNTPRATTPSVSDDVIVDSTGNDQTGLDEIMAPTAGGDDDDGGVSVPASMAPVATPQAAPAPPVFKEEVVANCFPAVTVFTNVNGVARITVSDVDAGSTGQDPLTRSLSQTEFRTLGKFFVTLTVVETLTLDSDDCTTEVTVFDGTPPIARCCDISRVMTNGQYVVRSRLKFDANNNEVIAFDIDNGSEDGFTSVRQEVAPAVITQSGFVPVRLTVFDLQGNSDSCTALVDVGTTDYCEEDAFDTRDRVHCNENGACLSTGPQNTPTFGTVFTPCPEWVAKDSVCECKEGWEGERCEKAICNPKCENGGFCVEPGKCTCKNGFIGERCQLGPPRWLYSKPVMGDSRVALPPGFLFYDIWFNQNIQFAVAGFFHVDIIETDVFGQITNRFTVRSDNIELEEERLRLKIPVRQLNNAHAYQITFPDNVITNGAVSWQPSTDIVGNTFIFGTPGYSRRVKVYYQMAITVWTKRSPDTCRFYDRDLYIQRLRSALTEAFVVPREEVLEVLCTSCDEEVTGKKCLYDDAFRLGLNGKMRIQAKDYPNAIIVYFAIDDVVDIAVEELERFLVVSFDETDRVCPFLDKFRAGGNVVKGSFKMLPTTATEALDLDVSNTPDEPKQPTTLTITFVSNPDASNILSTGFMDLNFPSGFILDPEPLGWDVTLIRRNCNQFIVGNVCLEKFVNGEFRIDGTEVIIDMKSSRMSNVAAGETLEILIDRGVTMPDTCKNLNAWIWSVSFLDRDTSIIQWKDQNVLSDTCADQSVFIFGDPHFVSFSGGTFDVTGEAGQIYNIISDKYFNWNSQFVSRGKRASMFTYLGLTGMLVNGSRVVCDPQKHEVIINGKSIPKEKYGEKLYLPGGVYYVKVAPEAVFLRVPGFRIILKYVEKDHGKVIPHFDQFVKLAEQGPDDPFGRDQPHGLLGQTVHFIKPVKPLGKNGQGVIQGTPNDYKVSRLFETRWRWNKYKLK